MAQMFPERDGHSDVSSIPIELQPLPENPRIAVVGAGAVGCYYGGRLAQHGANVHFLMRRDFDHVKEHGLHLHSWQGDARLPQVNVHRDSHDMGPCDLVIIALKATSNPALIDLLPPLLKPGTLLLTLQNGLGNEEFLAAHFGGERVLGGLCFVCINRIAPGVIDHIAQGTINLGEFSGPPQRRTHQIAELFQRSGIDCHVEHSLKSARWKKLVWNIPFNGLSIAAGGIDTAAILASEPLEQVVRSLMREVIDSGNQLGCDLPLALIDQMIDRTRTMGSYKPSSLVDYIDGREVEVDPIWGEPVRRAAAAGIAMPRVEMLHRLLQHAVAARGAPKV